MPFSHVVGDNQPARRSGLPNGIFFGEVGAATRMMIRERDGMNDFPAIGVVRAPFLTFRGRPGDCAPLAGIPAKKKKTRLPSGSRTPCANNFLDSDHVGRRSSPSGHHRGKAAIRLRPRQGRWSWRDGTTAAYRREGDVRKLEWGAKALGDAVKTRCRSSSQSQSRIEVETATTEDVPKIRATIEPGTPAGGKI